MAARADFDSLLLQLADAGVAFIVVGGVAAFIQGSELATVVLDIVHERREENVARLLGVLRDLGAHSRGQPELTPGPQALIGPGHQLLFTPLADLDVLGALEGDQSYDDLIREADEVSFRGRQIRVLSLEQLIALKKRSSREKDRIALAYLQAVARKRDV